MAKLIPPFNVLIIYNSITSGKNAMASCQRLQKNLRGEYDFSVQFLRTDMLEETQRSANNVHPATGMDMIFVAVEGDGNVKAVGDWLERLPQPVNSHKALVALVTEPRKNLGEQTVISETAYLRVLASRLGMDLIHSEAPLAGEVPQGESPLLLPQAKPSAGAAKRLETWPSAFAPTKAAPKRWGINE